MEVYVFCMMILRLWTLLDQQISWGGLRGIFT